MRRFIPNMLPNTMSWDSKVLKVVMQSDLSLDGSDTDPFLKNWYNVCYFPGDGKKSFI